MGRTCSAKIRASDKDLPVIGKHGQGTHCTKMGINSLAENTPNAPQFVCPICLPKPKNSGLQ